MCREQGTNDDGDLTHAGMPREHVLDAHALHPKRVYAKYYTYITLNWA